MKGALDAVVGAFGYLRDRAGDAIRFVRENWPLLLAILTGPIGLAVLFIVRHWDQITGAARGLRDSVVGAFADLRDRVRDIYVGFITGIVTRFYSMRDQVVDAFRTLRDRAGDALRGLGDAALGPVRTVLGAIRALLRGIGSVRFSIPGFTIDPLGPFGPDVTFRGFSFGLPDYSGLIPNLAAGATIMPTQGGTLVRVAEAGRPESVVDTGLLNRRLDEMEGLRGLLASLANSGVTFADGAVRLTIVRPPDEPTERSLNSALRTLGALGLFEGAPTRA